MSDISQGEGWWQASDGKWYAPELHPDYVPPADTGASEPTEAIPTAAEPEPTVAAPAIEGEPPIEPPIATFGTPPPAEGGGGGGKGKVIAAVVVILALIGAGIAYALTRDDDNKTATDKSDQSTSSSSSTNSSSSDTNSSSSETTAELLSRARRALLVPADLGTGFTKTTPDSSSSPLPCTGASPDDDTPPAGTVATELDRDPDLALIERIHVYDTERDAKTVFSTVKAGFNCANSSDGTLRITSRPAKVGIRSSDDDFAADGEYTGTAPANLRAGATTTTAPPTTDAFATDTTTAPSSSSGPDFQISYYVVRVGRTILSFAYIGTPTADTTGIDDPKTITNTGVAKFVK